MTNERMKKLLNNVIEENAIARNIEEQIDKLLSLGFTEDELINEFGYSEKDVRVEPRIQEEVKKLKKDAKVLVSDTGSDWFKRYFSHIKNDLVYAFENGCTSWTVETLGEDDGAIPWRYAKLPEE